MEARRYNHEDINRSVEEDPEQIYIPENWDKIIVTPPKGCPFSSKIGPALTKSCGVVIGYTETSMVIHRMNNSRNLELIKRFVTAVQGQGCLWTCSTI